MTIKVNDHVFLNSAKPVVITEIDKDERIHVADGGEVFDQIRTIGFKNGLETEDKKKLVSILTELKLEADPLKKVALLDEKIAKLKDVPPGAKEPKLARYLLAEKAFIINSSGVNPRYYTVNRLQVRV